MKKTYKVIFFLVLVINQLHSENNLAEVNAENRTSTEESKTNACRFSTLTLMYEDYCKVWSDIYEHLPTLKNITQECSSVIEIGVRDMVSTWAFLEGLAKSSNMNRYYLGIDLHLPNKTTFSLARDLATINGISFNFLAKNDLEINNNEIPDVDILFIDSLHTYCHLTYELEKFSPKTKKYIIMHDTSAPWGNAEDTEYRGDYSEYPVDYDKTKKGLWPAVEDFLKKNNEWKLKKRYFNNHGLTVLERVKSGE